MGSESTLDRGSMAEGSDVQQTRAEDDHEDDLELEEVEDEVELHDEHEDEVELEEEENIFEDREVGDEVDVSDNRMVRRTSRARRKCSKFT